MVIAKISTVFTRVRPALFLKSLTGYGPCTSQAYCFSQRPLIALQLLCTIMRPLAAGYGHIELVVLVVFTAFIFWCVHLIGAFHTVWHSCHLDVLEDSIEWNHMPCIQYPSAHFLAAMPSLCPQKHNAAKLWAASHLILLKHTESMLHDPVGYGYDVIVDRTLTSAI